MRVHVVLTNDEGTSYQGEAELKEIGAGAALVRATPASAVAGVDFRLPVRPFMKKYGAGMSGDRRFGLLVARMTEGRPGVPVQRSAVERLWNKMKPLMGGGFNSAYSNRAKDNGWVDSPKLGHYALLQGWSEILASRSHQNQVQ